ncbi:hypothetical protein HOY34_05535 [Xinfangfangia sp. D13-10-4-6]|uniref:hypothetical protein n=1 Tax=Pseudogemmobacter hezensis TaxID=2737662 RepID=UPI0015534405|nr:hypothetical protein [Pseudogemmobacter hezensis]NPD14665.1 hypothetical protein [Pseudogemmobacter hezensis]
MKKRLVPLSLLFFVPFLPGLLIGRPVPFWPYLLPVPFLAISILSLVLMAVFALLPWLGLLGTVSEVWRGRVHRLWLLPVGAVFAGYYAMFAWENHRYQQELRERAGANATVQVPFDPARQALVLPLYPAGELLRDYGVPVAYIGNPTDPSAPTQALRYIDRALCAELLARLPDGWIPGIDFGGNYLPVRQDQCMLTLPEVPDLPVIRVGLPPEGSEGHGPHPSDRGYLIASPDGAAPVILRDPAPAGLPLPWWPDLGGFCGRLFGKSAAAMGCVRLDWRQEWRIAPNRTEALATALGLKKVGPGGRVLSDPDLVRRKFDAVLADMVAEQIRRADLWIAGRPNGVGPDSPEMVQPIAAHLALNPGAFSSRAGQIVAALEAEAATEAATDAPDQTRMRSLETLLAALPGADLAPLLPRLERLQVAQAWQPGERLSRAMADQPRPPEPAQD